ncbi:MAG: glycoside hydrolase family 3 C-terminal domain-containing protein, partial [Oscillospiraceae bacterium]|nr:glycoside hydrolase family 3 C-terminal domain-containing protein [Oscillospiraceae bacterium]
LDSHDRRITLMGVASQDIVVSGGGSGSARQNNQSTSYNWNNAFEEEGFSVNPTIVAKYNNYKNNDGGYSGLHIEMPVSQLGDTETATYAAYRDAAVIVLYRWSTENSDLATYNAKGHSDPNDTELDLQDNEKDLIRHANKYFDKVIVLINSSYTMDVSELADPDSDLCVDAILWVGGVGQVGCLEAVKILEGKVNPSGRLPDTWWANLKADPAFPNVSQMNQNAEGNGRADAFFRSPQGAQTAFALVEYREGIYMGHRYYETVYDDLVAAGKQAEADKFYKETVAFPFGYGLSYTDFVWQLAGVSKNRTITTDKQYLTVQVAVTNVGSRAGKDVVELYNTAPYTKGGIEKASAALVGFAKTKELAPGETDIVTIRILAHDLASYDWNDKNGNGFEGYELEKGTYVLSARRNSHDVVLKVEFNCPADITCPIDLQSGNPVKNVFTDDDWTNFETVRDDYLENLISRENGLTQPKPVSLADRTLSEAEYALLQSEEFYYPYMDNPDQPWYVAKGGIPENWTQATTALSNAELTALRAKLPGVEYTEPKIVDGKVSFDHLTAQQKANNAIWDEYLNALTYDQLVSYYASAKGPLSGGLTGSDGPVTFGGGADWPTCPISAATWNVELIEMQGEMLGTQAMLNGTTGWRGGGIDTHRTPFNGRCFEYYSEDGVLAAHIARAVDTGVTSKGIMCYWKHYFNNDQEYRRANFGGVSVFITEQAMREIYLKPFEAVIKNGTAGVMTSFNRLGFIVNSNNWASHQKLMRDEWGYKGGTVNDQWAKSYVSQDLMVRAGDTYLMGSWNGYVTTGLTWGKWDAAQRDGKGLPLVPDADAASQNVKDGTVPSETQYYVMRLAAVRDARNEVNSCVMKNNVSSMTFTATAYQGINNYKAVVESPDTTNFVISGYDSGVNISRLAKGSFDGVEPTKETKTTSSGSSTTTTQVWTYQCEGFTVVENRNANGTSVTSTTWTYPEYSITETATNRTFNLAGGTTVSQTLSDGTVTATSYTVNGLTIATGGNAITVGRNVALGTYEIPVTVNCDNWVKNAPATIILKVVSPLTVNGEEISAEPINLRAGRQDITVSSDYYAYMNKHSDQTFLVMSAYNAGSGWMQRHEDESAADIVTLDYDAIKDLETFQAHEPKYEIVGDLPAGLTVTPIMDRPLGYCGLQYSSDINIGLKLTGNLAAGTYTFTVKLTTYTVNKTGTGGNWIRATAGTQVVVEQPVTIVVK